MMSIGLLVDLNQKNESPRADIYHRLARASLCEMNLMDEPNLDLIQTLVRHPFPLYAIIFTGFSVLHDLVSPHFLRQESGRGLCLEHHGTRCEISPKREPPPSPTLSLASLNISPLVGSSCVTLQSHRRSPLTAVLLPDRDGNRWKVIPEESQRRRMLFWELLNLDARLVCTTSFFALPLDLCPRHFPSDVHPRYVSIMSIVAVHRTQPLRCTSSRVPNHVSIAP